MNAGYNCDLDRAPTCENILLYLVWIVLRGTLTASQAGITTNGGLLMAGGG